MIADRAWVQRNLGFDPIDHARAGLDLCVREGGPSEPHARGSAAGDDRFRLRGAGWQGVPRLHHGHGPIAIHGYPVACGACPEDRPETERERSGPLPQADVLVVTWTVDEGHALSRVLTPGKDSHNDYVSYTHNFAAISKKMRKGCPALKAKRLGAYWTTTIGGKKVVVFKSDSHLSQDTKKLPAKNGTLPNYDVWKQIIEEVQPKLVHHDGHGRGHRAAV